MKTALSLTILAAVVAIFLSAAGCGKQAVSDDRVSRLTADENYRLKKQVDQLSKQIAVLTKDFEQAKQQETTLTATKKQVDQLNKQIAVLTKDIEREKQQQVGLSADKHQNDILSQENQQIKNSLNESTGNAQSLSEQLEECQKNLSTPENKRIKEMADELAKTKKEAEESVNFVMTTVREEGEKETAAIRDENEAIKAQIQKLQDELKQLKK